MALESGDPNETDSTECSTSSNLGRRGKAVRVGARHARERYGRRVMVSCGPVGIGLAGKDRLVEVRPGTARHGRRGVSRKGQVV